MKRNLLFAALFGAASILVLPGCGGEKAKEGDAKTTETPGAGSEKVVEGGNSDDGKFDPSGTYTLTKEDGTEATLTVTQSGGSISYTLAAHVGNAAEMERTATMKLVGDRAYEDSDDACQLSFAFSNDGCTVAYGAPFEGCGDVDCAGKYVQGH